MSHTLATELFREMVSRPPEQIDLAAAALMIAFDEYPGLRISEYVERIDLLAEKTAAFLNPDAGPMDVIQSINYQLFEIEGFRGNQQDYYDPRNSFLNEVLDRKTGIPITLSVLYMEIGRRLGLNVEGVGMPGHFIVSCHDNGVRIFVDPFGQGEILLEEGCQRKLAQLHGKEFRFDRSSLDAVDHRQILTRMLSNLKVIYWNQQNFAKALATIERILFIHPSSPTELRDHGFAHYQLSHLSSAIQSWSLYLELRPDAPDAAEVSKNLRVAAQLRAVRN